MRVERGEVILNKGSSNVERVDELMTDDVDQEVCASNRKDAPQSFLAKPNKHNGERRESRAYEGNANHHPLQPGHELSNIQ